MSSRSFGSARSSLLAQRQSSAFSIGGALDGVLGLSGTTGLGGRGGGGGVGGAPRLISDPARAAWRRSCTRLGISLLLVVATLTITATSFVGFVASDVQTRISVLNTTTSIVGSQLAANLDDTALMLKLVGWAWRRTNIDIADPAIDTLLRYQLRAFANTTLISTSAYVYIADGRGYLHGIQQHGEGQESSFLFDPVASAVTFWPLATNGTRLPGTVIQLPGFDVRKRGWYRDAVAGNGSVSWAPPYRDATSNSAMVTAAMTIFNFDGSFWGVVGSDIALPVLQRLLNVAAAADESVMPGTYSVLTSADGVLASTNVDDLVAISQFYDNLGDLVQWMPLTSTSLSSTTQALIQLIKETGCATQLACDGILWITEGASLLKMQDTQMVFPKAYLPVSQWQVSTVYSLPNLFRAQLTRLIISAVATLLICVYAAITTRCCATLRQRQAWCTCAKPRSHPSRANSLEMRQWRSNPIAVPAPSPEAHVQVSVRGSSHFSVAGEAVVGMRWSLHPLVVAVASSLVLGLVFATWTYDISQQYDLVTIKAQALQLLVQTRVNSLLRQPQQALTQVQVALQLDQLSYDPSIMYQNQNLSRGTERMLMDLVQGFQGTSIPIQGVIIGYPNGNSYGASYQNNIYQFRRRDTSTGTQLRFSGIGANGYRNDSDTIAPPISYDTVTRPWYVVAQQLPSGVRQFTDIYVFSDSFGSTTVAYGTTEAMALRQPGTDRFIAVGVHMTLELLTTLFQRLSPSAEDGLMFIAEDKPSLPLIATTVGDITGCTDSEVLRLGAVYENVTDVVFHRLALLANSTIGHHDGSQSFLLGFGLQQVSGRFMQLSAAGLNWVLAIGFYTRAFLRELDPFTNATIVVAAGSLWLVVSAAVRLTRREGAELVPFKTDPGFLDNLQGETLSARTTTTTYSVFEARLADVVKLYSDGYQPPITGRAPAAYWTPGTDPVWKAVCMLVQRRDAMGVRPTDEKVLQVVEELTRMSLEGRQCIKMVAMAIMSRFSWPRIITMKVLANSNWSLFMCFIAWAGMIVTMWEASNQDTAAGTTAAESVLYAVQLLHWCMTFAVAGLTPVAMSLDASGSSMSSEIMFGRPTARSGLFIFHTLLVVCVVADVIVRSVWPYHIGSTVAVHRSIPLAAILRPLFLIVYAPSIRSSVFHFFDAVLTSASVFSVMLAVLVVSTLVTLALLGQVDSVSDQIGEGFSDIRSALLSIFTFMCTKSNYLDVVNVAMQRSPWLLIYFIVVTFIGVMLLVSLLIASFQTTYTASFNLKQLMTNATATARRRLGLFLAFRYLRAHSISIALDTGTLSVAEPANGTARNALHSSMVVANQTQMAKVALSAFFGSRGVAVPTATAEFRAATRSYDIFRQDMQQTVAKLQRISEGTGCDEALLEEIAALGSRCESIHMFSKKVDQRMYSDITQFVSVCEANAQTLITGQPEVGTVQELAHWMQPTLWQFFDDNMSLTYSSMLNVLIKLNVLLLAVSGSFLKPFVMPPLYAFLAIHVWELHIRIWAEGWSVFWKWPRLAQQAVLGKPYLTSALRTDVVLVHAGLLFAIIGGATDIPMLVRLGLTLPVARLFTCSASRRTMIFGMMSRLPQFMPLVLLQCVVLYMYAVVGIWWFADQFQPTSSPAESTRLLYSNFDNFPNAVATLFQILAGDAWQDVMYLAFEARGSLFPVLYFLSYVILYVLMFTNVVIGIVVEAYQTVQQLEQQKKAPVEIFSRVQMDDMHRAAMKEKLRRFLKTIVLPRLRNAGRRPLRQWSRQRSLRK